MKGPSKSNVAWSTGQKQPVEAGYPLDWPALDRTLIYTDARRATASLRFDDRLHSPGYCTPSTAGARRRGREPQRPRHAAQHCLAYRKKIPTPRLPHRARGYQG